MKLVLKGDNVKGVGGEAPQKTDKNKAGTHKMVSLLSYTI